jgi:tetratricopeptide (TPR) repeat protein
MRSTKIGPLSALAALAVMVAVCLTAAGPARAADDEAALRKELLALNHVTGEDPARGQIDKLTEDPERTKKLLGLAVKMSKEKTQPFNFNGSYILARAAQLLKEVDASLALYKVAIDEATKLKSGSKIGQAYSGLITACYVAGKYEEAEKVCREFLEMKGDESVRRLKPIILRQMIQALAKQGKTEDAGKLIDDLLKVQPDNWLTLELRAWVQREGGQFDEAAKTYEEVLDRIMKDKELEKEEQAGFASEIRYLLSGVYVDAKKVDKAAEHLKALLKEEPDNPSYNNDLGYIWADHDLNLEEAEKLIRKAIEEDRKLQKKVNPELKPEDVRDNAAYLDSLGWVLFKQKKFKEAKPYLEQAVKDEDGQHIEILDHLAEIHMALGEKDKAVAAWKKGLEVAGPGRREQQRKAEVEKKLKAAQ